MKKESYNRLILDIGMLLEEGRRRALQSVNSIITETYWNVGKRIVDFEQHGEKRAGYGAALLELLSQDLTLKYRKGFSRRNLSDMRRFYLLYKNWQTVSARLSWSHYVELVSIKNNEERAFYEKQCFEENWGIRELRRQINSKLFYRLPASKKAGLFGRASRVKAAKIGNSIAIRVPKEIAEFVHLKPGMDVIIHPEEGKMIVEVV